MPSTIDIQKKDAIALEEKQMRDTDHGEANGHVGKGKMSVPLRISNGSGAEDAEDDDTKKACEEANTRLKQTITKFKDNLKLLRVNDQVKELQTTLRDR